jgi:NADH-quinone oxidoreductase subunit A
MHYEYKSILIFLVFSIALSIIILGASYMLALQKGDIEKLSPYECGFNPFQDSRQEFDVKFYLVAILFIIFDLEISFLFPWSISLNVIMEETTKEATDIITVYYGYWSMLLFLLILTIGFVYEWKKGALNW